MIPEKIKSYFTFSKRERIGICALIFLIVSLLILQGLIHDRPFAADQESIRKFEAQLATPKIRVQEDEKEKNKDDSQILKNPRLFYFDPNSLNEAGWKSLGLREKTIRTITHYLNKGGRFRKADELLKVYGINKEEYALLKPFVRINNNIPRKNFNPSTIQHFDSSTTQHFNHSIHLPIDINKADTSAFITLRGIGQKLAARIVLFREKLGGFYSVDQVRETYGLPDSVFIAIKPLLKIGEEAESGLRKIDLNSSGIEELRQHPYIRWNLARAIVEFRNQHGPFTKPEELERLHILSQADILKIRPYLKIN